MIYTKKNLREFVNVVNEIIETDPDAGRREGKFIISERDGEIYRGYQWGVDWQKSGSTGREYIGWGGQYGSPRHAAINLLETLMKDFAFYYPHFWTYAEFRACVRDIENY